MVFRDNFKRFIEEKTGMKTSTFLKELGMSYSVVKSLDEEGIEVLTEKQLNKFCDALELSKEEFARLWDEDYYTDEVPAAHKRMSCDDLKKKLMQDHKLKVTRIETPIPVEVDPADVEEEPAEVFAEAAEPEKIAEENSKSGEKYLADAVGILKAAIEDYEENDVVNHPAHYTSGKMECIDIVDVMTEDKQGLEAFCTGNIVKYLYRYNKKGGVEDVKKAEWYFKKLIEVLEKKQ